MSRIITEDIINNAINESIDEFMLEEGWGDAAKWAWNGLKKLGKGIGNAAKLYMDYRTNGKWNRKYGYYNSGNDATTEMMYLQRWFNYHLKAIQRIEERISDPSYNDTETFKWKDNGNGKRTAVQTINKSNDVQSYAQRYINANAFNRWIKNTLQDREPLECIDNYITKYCSNITNFKNASQVLNLYNFYASDEGKEYLELASDENGMLNKRSEYAQQKQAESQASEQQNQANQIEQQTKQLIDIKNTLPSWQKWLEKNFTNDNKWFNEAYGVIDKTLDGNIKNWMFTVLKNNARMDAQTASQYLTYNNFINDCGKQYAQEAIKQANAA